MSLPVLFEGYMMLQHFGDDLPVAYKDPNPEADNFKDAYTPFIKANHIIAQGAIGRDHVEHLSNLSDKELGQLSKWEPNAFVEKVSVDYRGDIHIAKYGLVITREDLFGSARISVPKSLQDCTPCKVDMYSELNSKNMDFAVTFIQYKLQNVDSKKLFQAILQHVSNDSSPEFTETFTTWMRNDGETVLLRDALCRPFKSMFDDCKVEGRQNLAWDNAWTAIDSAKLAYREVFRIGSLRASVDTETEYDEGHTTPRR